jgi:hypothetical protein
MGGNLPDDVTDRMIDEAMGDFGSCRQPRCEGMLDSVGCCDACFLNDREPPAGEDYERVEREDR